MDDILAFLQSSGSSPEIRDCSKSSVSTGAISPASSWMTQLGMLPGPEDLLTFSSRRSSRHQMDGEGQNIRLQITFELGSVVVLLSEERLELITEDLGFSLTVTVKLTILFKGCNSCGVLFSRFDVLPEWLTVFLLKPLEKGTSNPRKSAQGGITGLGGQNENK